MYVISGIIAPILLGLLFVILVPIAVDKLIEFKNSKRSIKIEPIETSKLFKIIFPLIIGVLSTYVVIAQQFPIWKSAFIIVFCFIGCVGTIVDNKVRIIPNELVLLILFLAVPYRFLDGGFYYLLNSVASTLGVLLFLVGTFFVIRMFLASVVPAGAGDLKLIMAMGFVLGYPNILYGMFYTMIVMVGYIGFGLVTGRLTFRSYIPMAGFIMTGLIIGLLSGGESLWEVLKIF